MGTACSYAHCSGASIGAEYSRKRPGLARHLVYCRSKVDFQKTLLKRKKLEITHNHVGYIDFLFIAVQKSILKKWYS